MKVYRMTGRTGIDYGITFKEKEARNFLDYKPDRKVEVAELPMEFTPYEYTPAPKPPKPKYNPMEIADVGGEWDGDEQEEEHEEEL